MVRALLLSFLLSLLLSAALIAAAHLLDGPGLALHLPGTASTDAHRLLRICGFLPTWAAIGGALALHQRQRTAGGLIFLSAGLSGLLAELAKLLTRRQRPSGLPQWEYTFRPFSEDPLSTAALGMPSSHTAVAFGGAFMLWRLYPRTGPVVLLMAMGCGLTRVIEQAHFISDVVAAAVLAFWVAWGLRRDRSQG